jgi:chromosome segregation ATPase
VDGAWPTAVRRSTVLIVATDSELRRRVTRLENATESIYELLTEIRSTQLEHTQRFDEHTSRLDEHTVRFDEHTQRFDEHTQRFDEHTQRFDEIQTTLGEVLRRLPEPS